ncbi:hypothetical protein ACHQM5_004171 [Ranunculus cassubicifolius]
MNNKHQETQSPPPSSSTTTTATESPATPPPSSSSDQHTEKWGTHIMGAPAPPSSHPNNQKAAMWSSDEHHQPSQQPYVQHTPLTDHKSSSSPIDPVVNAFNSWSSKAEDLARNIWKNLKTGPSLSDTVYGKVGLTTKVLTGGGFEALYKQTFVTEPNEKLKKTFACYLSTSTGPVAGTLYLSTLNVSFCSDRPLSFTAPSREVAWSYYKIVVPLAKISTINPIITHDNPSEKYIQIGTVDGHDFWFMGFVNYDKATNHLSQSFSELKTNAAQPNVGYPSNAAQPGVGNNGNHTTSAQPDVAYPPKVAQPDGGYPTNAAQPDVAYPTEAQPGVNNPTKAAQPDVGYPTTAAQPDVGHPTTAAQPGVGNPTKATQPDAGHPTKAGQPDVGYPTVFG